MAPIWIWVIYVLKLSSARRKWCLLSTTMHTWWLIVGATTLSHIKASNLQTLLRHNSILHTAFTYLESSSPCLTYCCSLGTHNHYIVTIFRAEWACLIDENASNMILQSTKSLCSNTHDYWPVKEYIIHTGIIATITTPPHPLNKDWQDRLWLWWVFSSL